MEIRCSHPSEVSVAFYPLFVAYFPYNNRIIDFYTRLLRATFISREPGYEHPLGYSSDALLYLDGKYQTFFPILFTSLKISI